MEGRRPGQAGGGRWGEARGREGNGKQGSARGSGHALERNSPSSFPGKRRRSPRPPGAPSWELAHGAGRTSARRRPRAAQVLRGQPGEALPPGLPAADHPGPHTLPLPSLPQHHSREQSPRGLLATARGPLQMFAAGPWLAPDAREDGQEAGRLLFTCSGGAGRACRASGSGQRGQERVRTGKGVCPPTPLPRQALPPKMSLFTARRGDFLLLEKRAFL